MKDDIRLIVIGASTGGVEATKRVLSFLPKEMPPIVIVQHMPAGFTQSYAKRLDGLLPATAIVLIQNPSIVISLPSMCYSIPPQIA